MNDELSVRVVLFRRDASGARVPVYRTDSGDLRESATVLTAPVGVPRAVVRTVLGTEVPAEFAADPWLHRHRALVFADGRCRVGAHELRYHEEFGVYADEEP
ncbi:hypothetical protein [Amycolatopsis samaneae]|uniref:Cas3 C-terminal domain-containing protein n=1 Tax=Amycolatopsis samaneae TaxID=664691 RepID=A0ABW5GME8_9PSEU